MKNIYIYIKIMNEICKYILYILVMIDICKHHRHQSLFPLHEGLARLIYVNIYIYLNLCDDWKIYKDERKF